ncbi:uncharacterized protein FOMMEDRAFT_79993, partial [Fomitiporia mediterranea MF3/22]|uniref:uncharacterized protein n=1 Tax=Fomitiporia mediterranea (strain MF3/22) TaxID=694068 RepID=UPI0004408FBA
VLTEEQKIQEGKRMFSIFAARMFEARVLSAYREKIARERQMQLLQELEEEETARSKREAKKAKENQKRKDKKRYAMILSIFHTLD